MEASRDGQVTGGALALALAWRQGRLSGLFPPRPSPVSARPRSCTHWHWQRVTWHFPLALAAALATRLMHSMNHRPRTALALALAWMPVAMLPMQPCPCIGQYQASPLPTCTGRHWQKASMRPLSIPVQPSLQTLALALALIVAPAHPADPAAYSTSRTPLAKHWQAQARDQASVGAAANWVRMGLPTASTGR